ncbi:uncharacterized protein EDB91DRAFT_1160485 [Suillus paluster]|uniref:uncharacterized protein n=1 Tax=Suillus paluster TaxID=48578 RepID=UPI001B87515E|nr:uncharacterized protein EDB91DRAFT_1160485 [Suillus paluster]KAG1728831.1 hypothetical protein EDB91DRAFT_1160485 [Suillus paluster]
MARTKQTALSSCGGTAKRVSLKPRTLKTEAPPEALQLEVAKATVPAQALKMVRSHLEVRSGPSKNHFCMLCQGGVAEGVSIYECNEPDCPRVMCTRCISIPSNCVQEVTQPGVKFRCIHCHTSSDKKSNQLTLYYGFFRDGEPVLPTFLEVCGQLEFSRRSQISSAPILIVHFKLAGCGATASPIDATHTFLAPYFPHGGLRLVNVVFDLADIDYYSKQCVKLVNDVMEDRKYEFVCIAITDHTNDAIGAVPEFMDTLLDPWRNVIRRAKDTTLFLLGCGAIVNQPENFRGLRTSIVNHRISSAVAFTAKHFRPTSACHFMISFAQSVLIECFPLREAFPKILDQSELGMHSDVILMSVTSGDNHDGLAMLLQCTRYSWAHVTARPWGNTLPIQCPQCGCPTQWQKFHADASRKCSVFECSYAGCGRVNGKPSERLPRKKFTCKAPKGAILLPGRRRNACWLQIPPDRTR